MYDKILREMRKAVKAGRVVLRPHAYRALKDEKLERDDAINCILTGEIVSDQYDGDMKYVINGEALSGAELGLVVRDFDNLTWPHFDAFIWPHLSLMFTPGDLAASGMCTKN